LFEEGAPASAYLSRLGGLARSDFGGFGTTGRGGLGIFGGLGKLSRGRFGDFNTGQTVTGMELGLESDDVEVFNAMSASCK